MKLQTHKSDIERSILTGAIVSDRVLSRIVLHLGKDRRPFRSRWSNIIFSWCRSYFAQYQKAPRRSIQSLFNSYAQKSTEDESVTLIDRFLQTLSDDYRAIARSLNEDYLVDQASKFFNTVRLDRLRESLEAELAQGNVDEAHRQVIGFSPVNLSSGDFISVFTDRQALVDALTQTEEDVLVHYPSALGEFFGKDLCRDAFVAFMAPEKRGKSYWLMDLAWRSSVRNKRRTLFYSVGDMSQRQMMRRLVARAARRPIDPGEYVVPIRMDHREGGLPRIRLRRESVAERMTVKEAASMMHHWVEDSALDYPLLKLRCTSNDTTRVTDIRLDVEQQVQQGWVPDVVVIDYADILAAETGSGDDYRHQINKTWQALRRLSQDFHLLVVTATQTNAASYESETLRRKHQSEDKRKIAHATGMVGINQTEEEKERGIFRLNWVARRESAYQESRCVFSAGCLAIGNPAMKSTWRE